MLAGLGEEKLTHSMRCRVAVTHHGPLPPHSTSASLSKFYKAVAPFLAVVALIDPLDARTPAAGSLS